MFLYFKFFQQQVLFYLAILLHNGTEGEVEIVPLFQVGQF